MNPDVLFPPPLAYLLKYVQDIVKIALSIMYTVCGLSGPHEGKGKK